MMAFGSYNMNYIRQEDFVPNGKPAAPAESGYVQGTVAGQTRRPAPADENNFLNFLFGDTCRKQCKEKLKGKGAGFKDCVRDCKGKGITKSKQKEIELGQQDKLQEILGKAVQDDSGSEKGNAVAWVILVVVLIALFGGIIYFMKQQKAAAATA